MASTPLDLATFPDLMNGWFGLDKCGLPGTATYLG
jgi:hypothetical protein